MKEAVLVVDDEYNVLQAIQRNLRNEPYDIFIAQSAREAMSLLRTISVDVIVSDEHMPTMLGTELLTVVREQYPETMRILFTGQPDVDVAQRAVNEGAIFRFLLKPCSDIDLGVAIREAIQEKKLRETQSHVENWIRETPWHDREARDEAYNIKRSKSGAVIIDEVSLDEVAK